MAVRTIACLPAITGAWRDVGGGVLLSTSGTFPTNNAALERPDLIAPGTRTLNMSSSGGSSPTPASPPGSRRCSSTTPTRARWPGAGEGARGLAREDLFTVVHELFPTDTVDFATSCCPPPRPSSTTTSTRPTAISTEPQQARDRAPRRGPAEHRGVPPPGRADGPRSSVPAGERRGDGPAGHALGPPEPGDVTFERLERREACASPCPIRTHRSRKAASRPPPASASSSLPPWPRWASIPWPATCPRGRAWPRPPSWPASTRWPSSPSGPPFPQPTFSAQPAFVRREGEPSLTLHPRDAAARGIEQGQMVRAFNDRGSFLARAHVSDAARPGLVVGLSIWWAKMCPGGRNANAVTGQELTDMGEARPSTTCWSRFDRRELAGLLHSGHRGRPHPVAAPARPAHPGLLAMFALLAIGHSRDDWFAARPWHLAGGAAGLGLLYLLRPATPPRPDPGPARHPRGTR